MADTTAILGGALLLLAAALSPIKTFFKSGGRSFGASGTNEPGHNSGTSSKAPAKMPAINAIDVYNLPKNRVLTEDEVMALAEHIVDRYGFNMAPKQLTAVAYVESSFRPWVERDEGFDKSTGLMQTLLGTARDLYSKGYKAVGYPTDSLLKDPYVSMYFGAAYFHWMKKGWSGKSLEWYIRAYNGGPGWEKTKAGPSMTAKYYDKWFSAMKLLSIKIRTVGS